jgi:hypothetical protein
MAETLQRFLDSGGDHKALGNREELCEAVDRVTAYQLERELGEEQNCFIEGCQRDWNQLPAPDGPLTVGIDGDYVSELVPSIFGLRSERR